MSCEQANKGHAFTFASGVLFRSYRNRFHGQVAKKQARAQVVVSAPRRHWRRWR